jgi:hypothetical protein
MRVATRALPARGPSANRDHLALRVAFVEHRDGRHMVGIAVMGESTDTAIGTVLPLSTSGAMSSVTRPVCTVPRRR